MAHPEAGLAPLKGDETANQSRSRSSVGSRRHRMQWRRGWRFVRSWRTRSRVQRRRRVRRRTRLPGCQRRSRVGELYRRACGVHERRVVRVHGGAQRPMYVGRNLHRPPAVVHRWLQLHDLASEGRNLFVAAPLRRRSLLPPAKRRSERGHLQGPSRRVCGLAFVCLSGINQGRLQRQLQELLGARRRSDGELLLSPRCSGSARSTRIRRTGVPDTRRLVDDPRAVLTRAVDLERARVARLVPVAVLETKRALVARFP